MDTKVCSICEEPKSLDEFAWKNKTQGIKEGRCRDCKNVYTRGHYHRNAEKYKRRARSYSNKARDENLQKLVQYLREHPCVDCGEKDVVVLEFDHLRDKRASVMSLANHGCNWETITAEISKCEVRCSNCHKRRTAKTRGWKWKV